MCIKTIHVLKVFENVRMLKETYIGPTKEITNVLVKQVHHEVRLIIHVHKQLSVFESFHILCTDY